MLCFRYFAAVLYLISLMLHGLTVVGPKSVPDLQHRKGLYSKAKKDNFRKRNMDQ